jgi:outer membrane protein OmpA-like peptidoglycan-associated protein
VKISVKWLSGFALAGVALTAMAGLNAAAARTDNGSAVAAITAEPISAEQSQAATVSRTTKAFNYRQAGGSRQVDFAATDLMGGASGSAKVEVKASRVEIEAKFAGLDEATKFGLEYLTYVLWAISPQGRAVNLGEVVVKNGAGSVKGVTDMQTFGMIVTAEPYYAVSQPGDEVILENSLPTDSNRVENIEARYQLISRGSYGSANTKIDNAIFGVDRKAPLELFEARNAVRIARNAMADKYAGPTFAKAEEQLKNAEDAYRTKRDKKNLIGTSRNVVETAEEARVIAVQKKSEEDAQMASDAERKAAAEREAKARADAAAETLRRQQADEARAQADVARTAALQAQADAEKMRQQAEAAAAAAAKNQQDAEAARTAALAQQQAAEAAAAAANAQAEQSRAAAAQAEKDKADMRAQLLAQLNAVLQTQDTARGLIVNMSDVLFDFGKYTLKPAAREKLAKISGIVLAHPGLALQIEGYTDSVGSDQVNQQLSERRADTVRDYLIEQGVAGSAITAKGFGKANPVASNDTADGRSKNRRVQLVVNGDAIGKPVPEATPGQ